MTKTQKMNRSLLCRNQVGAVQVNKDEEIKSTQSHIPCICSQRWILAYNIFIGSLLFNALRVNISVALPCMVKTEDTAMVFLSNESNHNDTESYSCLIEGNDPSVSQNAEFEWDKTVQSSIIASYFYGYIVMQIPGGLLADKYGGRRIFGIGMLIGAIATLLHPLCARTSVESVYVLRIVIGMSSGLCFPCTMSMWGRWAPPVERSQLASVSQMGMAVGSIIGFSVSGVLCEYGFDNGWGSIFYVTGTVTVIWVVVWFIFTRDSPSTHPFISEEEKTYILSSIEYNTEKRTLKVPWRSVATSKPFIAIFIAHITYDWTIYTLITCLPLFMKEALHFDIKQNGFLSSLPFLVQTISQFLSGHVADAIRARKLLSVTSIRKLFQLTGSVGAGAFLAAIGFLTCHQKYLTVAFICISTCFMGLPVSGFIANYMDIAPKYAGILFGIANTAATLNGMVAPILVGFLTPNKTTEEWRNVFFVCVGFHVIGILVYGAFGSGKLEPWAKDGDIQPNGTDGIVVVDDIVIKQTDKTETQTSVAETAIFNGVDNKGYRKEDNIL